MSEYNRFHPLEEVPTDSEGFPLAENIENDTITHCAAGTIRKKVTETVSALSPEEIEAIQEDVVAKSPQSNEHDTKRFTDPNYTGFSR